MAASPIARVVRRGDLARSTASGLIVFLASEAERTQLDLAGFAAGPAVTRVSMSALVAGWQWLIRRAAENGYAIVHPASVCVHH